METVAVPGLSIWIVLVTNITMRRCGRLLSSKNVFWRECHRAMAFIEQRKQQPTPWDYTTTTALCRFTQQSHRPSDCHRRGEEGETHATTLLALIIECDGEKERERSIVDCHWGRSFTMRESHHRLQFFIWQWGGGCGPELEFWVDCWDLCNYYFCLCIRRWRGSVENLSAWNRHGAETQRKF